MALNIVVCKPETQLNLSTSDATSDALRNLSYFNGNISALDYYNGTLENEGICWDPGYVPHNDYMFRQFTNWVHLWMTPVVIGAGVAGNLLSFLVFSLTHLRRQSSSVYLASLALADLIFLLALLVVWLRRVDISLFDQNGVCQLVVYVKKVTTFLSVWFVASFTIERYIIVWWPLRKDRFCTTKRARIIVMTLTVVACCLYCYSTFTYGIPDFDGIPDFGGTGFPSMDIKLTICMPLHHYFYVETVMTFVDSAVTLVLPSAIVIILNVRIVIKIVSVNRERRLFLGTQSGISIFKKSVRDPRHGSVKFQTTSCCDNNEVSLINHVGNMSKPSSSGDRCMEHHTGNCNSINVHPVFTKTVPPLSTTTTTTLATTHIRSTTDIHKQHTKVRVKRRSQYRTAKMLIIVSTIFVSLNIPTHVFRLWTFIVTSEKMTDMRSRTRWQELLEFVFHLQFSLNFFIYSACARQFRTGVKILYGKSMHKMKKWKRALTYHREGGHREFTSRFRRPKR